MSRAQCDCKNPAPLNSGDPDPINVLSIYTASMVTHQQSTMTIDYNRLYNAPSPAAPMARLMACIAAALLAPDFSALAKVVLTT